MKRKMRNLVRLPKFRFLFMLLSAATFVLLLYFFRKWVWGNSSGDVSYWKSSAENRDVVPLPRFIERSDTTKTVQHSRSMITTRFIDMSSPLMTTAPPKGNGNSTSTIDPRSVPLLFCVLINDYTSYGRGRSFMDMLSVIQSSLPNTRMTALALLVSSLKEYNVIVKLLDEAMTESSLPFASVSIGWPFGTLRKQLELNLTREERKQESIQIARRRKIAVLRNTLMYAFINTMYEAIVWMDSDIIEVPKEVTEKAILSGRDIVVPACYIGDNYYDENTFIGERTVPKPDETIPDFRGNVPKGKNLYVPRHVPGKNWPLSDVRFANEDFVQLTSVGGTWLYMSMDVILAGVNFGIFNTVGTTWDSEGYDAIETESICYVAKKINKHCWGMPKMRIQHSPNEASPL